jgi:hypothetical protein
VFQFVNKLPVNHVETFDVYPTYLLTFKTDFLRVSWALLPVLRAAGDFFRETGARLVDAVGNSRSRWLIALSGLLATFFLVFDFLGAAACVEPSSAVPVPAVSLNPEMATWEVVLEPGFRARGAGSFVTSFRRLVISSQIRPTWSFISGDFNMYAARLALTCPESPI